MATPFTNVPVAAYNSGIHAKCPMRAAWEAGYFASGVELDQAAASFATRYCPRGLIYALPLESFRSQYPNQSSMWLHFLKY